MIFFYKNLSEKRLVDDHTLCRKAEIEHLLIDAVQRKTMGHVLQDLVCKKCSAVKDANMRKYCTCAGKYKNLHSKDNILQLLRTFASIAQHYRMPLLAEVIEWIQKMNSFNLK